METNKLEYGRGRGNSRCSGEMRRYREEHQWRRQLAGTVLTLRRESVGLNSIQAVETVKLESGRGHGNSQCSGEMRRYWEEHQRRKRVTGPELTLMDES